MTRFSSTLSEGKSRRPSGTIAMPRSTIAAEGSAPIGRPSKRTVSGAFRMTPAMERSSVVLPAPLAPMIATVSPGSSAMSTPNSAWKSP